MMSFRGVRLEEITLPLSTVWLLESLAESKGRQQIYKTQTVHLLESLRRAAIVESVESSNRIEGVTVERERLQVLMEGRDRPRDRSEEEIAGYRLALNWIHSDYDSMSLIPETCLRLHGLAQGGTSGDAGKWKERPNEIIELLPDGSRRIRFNPLEPEMVPEAMKELFLGYRHSVNQGKVVPLLASACLILDFLCIHPFRDGNGRVSRLLTLLVLYQHGYWVGRYISLERIVEQTREEYYDALRRSSQGWHDGKHDFLPWFTYFLSVLKRAYRELEERVEQQQSRRGAKSAMVEYALNKMTGPFAMADLQRLCPGVSRDTIRGVMNRWRKEGRLELLGKGRDATWRVKH